MTSEGFGTWLGRFRSHKRASITTTTSRRTPKQRTQEIKGFMHHELQTNTRSISIQKPRGHKEGRASFPTQIQYTTQEFIPKTLEKEREKNLREREREQGRRWRLAPLLLLCPTHPPRRGRLPFCPGASRPTQLPPSLSSPPSLPLMTQLPLSAEIKLQGP